MSGQLGAVLMITGVLIFILIFSSPTLYHDWKEWKKSKRKS